MAAQQAGTPVQLQEVDVTAQGQGAYASEARYQNKTVTVGPLGERSVQDTPFSINTITQDMIVNTQARELNTILTYLPSVQISNQQGGEVTRPQSRGFYGSVVQNTRLDGLNIIGTTAIPVEILDNVQVLNGMAGALYGPAAPSGTFSYTLKRPTDVPLARALTSFDSLGVMTGYADVSARTGPNNMFGYRFNFKHGQGQSYVANSFVANTLYSGSFDVHLTEQTVVELDAYHYQSLQYGLPGAFVYGGSTGQNPLLPAAIDPKLVGYGQPNYGTNLSTDSGDIKIRHAFNNDWSLLAGGLYQNANRGLSGISNTLASNNTGNYTTTAGYTAASRFDIGSNMLYINGHLNTWGITHDVTIGTNGYINGQYNNKNSTTFMASLGSASIGNPMLFAPKAIGPTGGQYLASRLFEQSIIAADTIHFNDQWSLQGVLNSSWLSVDNYNAAGVKTSQDRENGVLSPTASVMFKPIEQLTTYFTFADGVQQGDTAASGSVNFGQTLAPYRSYQYELGAKYAVNENFLLTLDGFRMTRPLAYTDAATKLFQVQGEQRNWGIEFFGSGAITPELSAVGGVTWLDPRLEGTSSYTTSDKLVIGVPHWTSNVFLDYHPTWSQGIAFTLNTRYESARAATTTNNSWAPAYATLDLGLRYSTKIYGYNSTLRFQVANITDTRYWTSLLLGSINGVASTNTAWIGAPRTFQLTYEMDF
ncbi:TonB-dependent receptor [Beijerinckia indica]|uniref:TonB-dependent receptor n=1 Tax=Beijerinckia indica TaxID=533 RepID=UPI0002DA6573|nr:TonB-dependent siderophore receptor [Beijerinckia indica]